jgi:hypothetical protein
MLKSELSEKHELLSCDPDTQEKAKCFVDDRKARQSGWCWGPESAIGAEKHGIRCEVN